MSTQLSGLNREGRKPLFTAEKAFELLEARKMFADATTTTKFIDEMVAAGVIPKRCCTVSMQRLLNGTMFPHLQVYLHGMPSGIAYDYNQVPRMPRGQPPRPGVKNEGIPKKPMSRLREALIEIVVLKAEDKISSNLNVLRAELLSEMNVKFQELRTELKQITELHKQELQKVVT